MLFGSARLGPKCWAFTVASSLGRRDGLSVWMQLRQSSFGWPRRCYNYYPDNHRRIETVGNSEKSTLFDVIAA